MLGSGAVFLSNAKIYFSSEVCVAVSAFTSVAGVVSVVVVASAVAGAVSAVAAEAVSAVTVVVASAVVAVVAVSVAVVVSATVSAFASTVGVSVVVDDTLYRSVVFVELIFHSLAYDRLVVDHEKGYLFH